MGLGTGGRTITKVGADVIKDGTITLSKFATTGTASASTVLYGDFSWASGAPSGKRDITATNATPTAGDMWFEASQLQFAIDSNAAIGAFVTAASQIAAGMSYVTGFGVQAATVRAGGNVSNNGSLGCETYNGTVWDTTNNLVGHRRESMSCGNLGAGLTWGGFYAPSPLSSSEEYDGACWSTGNALPAAAANAGGVGTQSAALNAGPSTTVYSYDGTSWTSANSCSHVVASVPFMAGTLTAAYKTGATSPASGQTEIWDGTCWSAGNPSSRSLQQGMSAGSVNAGLNMGGYPNIETSEEYDGTSFSAGPDMLVGIDSGGGSGSQSAGLTFNGHNGSASVKTAEEYHKFQNRWSVV